MTQYQGKNVVIIGGTSGIGLSTAKMKGVYAALSPGFTMRTSQGELR